ncbi:hypothetical protein Mapa_016825 [Marchantia paleacea]|nr:hypothetical protein Mapa_016825 [Marchantia paleacea]
MYMRQDIDFEIPVAVPRAPWSGLKRRTATRVRGTWWKRARRLAFRGVARLDRRSIPPWSPRSWWRERQGTQCHVVSTEIPRRPNSRKRKQRWGRT